MAAGACGGVIQNTPYIGQPAYKAIGGRAAYTLATAIFIGAAGLFGWFAHLFEWMPEPAAFCILIFVGLEITAQSFRATPQRHFPAVALAMLPALAYLALIPLDEASRPAGATVIQSLRCLANGFVVTSLLWASMLVALVDGQLLRSVGLSGHSGRLQSIRHYSFAVAARGDRSAPACVCRNAARRHHSLPIPLPLGGGICVGRRVIDHPASLPGAGNE